LPWCLRFLPASGDPEPLFRRTVDQHFFQFADLGAGLIMKTGRSRKNRNIRERLLGFSLARFVEVTNSSVEHLQ
jgi:hypothetical protein